MNNSLAILSEIEIMLREKHVSFEGLTHLKWIRERTDGKRFSMSEHIQAMIYSLLTNNRRWEQVERHIEQIDCIFFNYDKKKILSTPPDWFVEQIQEIKCGNRSIKNQMDALHGNVHKLEKIEEEFGSLDHFVTSGTPIEIADLLANSLKYKIHTMGLALAMEYLRNVGIDAIKPDTHICRILGNHRLGYSPNEVAGDIEAIKIIEDISQKTGYLLSEIDAILWLFCADEKGMICTKRPHCEECRLNGKYCNWNAYEDKRKIRH